MLPTRRKYLLSSARALDKLGVTGVIYSPEDFSTILERERLRAERHNLDLSVITLSLGDGMRNGHFIESVARTVFKRVRTTDEVGWMKAGTLGVILPYTSLDGARKLSSALSGELAHASGQLRITIYSSLAEAAAGRGHA